MSATKEIDAKSSVASGVERRRDIRRLDQAPLDARQAPGCTRLLPTQIFEVERMASQGMNLDSIADRLMIPHDVWNVMMRLSPDIADAYRNGMSRLVDTATAAAVAGVKAGEPSLIKYMLDRFGGPQFRPTQQPAVVIQTGPMIEIDADGMARRFERQRALIDGTAEELDQT